ncbi:hypothetical protein SAMN05660816_01736 [Niastella yeongjuensis]|nr:hypothetical protein SAMN05660816_01736 [Niastella yeongjuensis]
MQLVNDFYVKSFCVVCFFVKRAAKIGVFNLLPNIFHSYFSNFAETPAWQAFQQDIFFKAFSTLNKSSSKLYLPPIIHALLLCSNDFNILRVRKIHFRIHYFL